MDRPSHGNPVEVSAHWTPQHLDVTDAPLRYAAPKAAWIDGFERLRPVMRTDAEDRMARRRVQTHSVVDPAEITVLPPLAVAARRAEKRSVRERSVRAWFGGVRSVSRLVSRRRTV